MQVSIQIAKSLTKHYIINVFGILFARVHKTKGFIYTNDRYSPVTDQWCVGSK